MGTFFATHEAELYHYGRKGMRRGRHLPDVLDPTRELIGKMVPTRSNISARQMTGRDAQMVRRVKNKVANPTRISGVDADTSRRFYNATRSRLQNYSGKVIDATRHPEMYEKRNSPKEAMRKVTSLNRKTVGSHNTASDYIVRKQKVNATRKRVSQRQAAETNRIRKEREEHDTKQKMLNKNRDMAINEQKARDTAMKKKQLSSEKAAGIRKDISARTSEGIAKAMTVGSSTKKAIKKSEKRLRSDARKEKLDEAINSLKNKHEVKRRKKLYNKTHDGSTEERAPYATANRAVDSEYQRNLDANSGKKSKVSDSIGDVLSAKQRRKLQKRLDRSEELSRSDVPLPQYKQIQAEAYNKALRKRAYEQKEADKKAEFEKRRLNHKKAQEKYIREQKELADFWQEDQRKVEREKDELKRRKLNNRR